jgi:fused signal recognition particle receptor
MFKFLKEKLKEAVSKFSKKVEEEIDEPEESVSTSKEIAESEEKKKKKIEEKAERREDKKDKREHSKESVKKAEEKSVAEEKGDVSEEKKTFFERIKERFSIRRVPKEEIEEGLEKAKELEEEIVEEKEIEKDIEKEIKAEDALKEETLKAHQEKKREREKHKFKEKEKTPEKEESREETKKEDAIEENKNLEQVEQKEKSFGQKIKDIFTKKELTEQQFDKLFWDLELALLENNVAVEVVEKIKKDLRRELVGRKLLRGKISQEVVNALDRSIEETLSVENIDIIKLIKSSSEKPFVIVFLGINGSGKTTTIAKIAYALKQHKITSVIAASDTFRAAAIQQLEHHAKNLDVKLIKHDYGADAAAVAYDAIEYAKAHKTDVVLIDTAGRLHSNKNLMEELKKIVRVTKPHLKIFVGESITGNDCVEQAKTFNEEIGIDGIILTKADVDEKGGAALSMSYITKKPIIYLGIGQKYEDLETFNPKKQLNQFCHKT